MRQKLLEGLRVVEVGAMWAGPYGARILGDLGAEVIKVEAPKHPDPVRFGFYPGNEPGDQPWERGGHFQKFGRNKKSCILDLADPRGQEVLHRLLRVSDVLLENNTPRVRERLGMAHDLLALEAPNLVVVSLPGFGDEGPYRDYLAFGLNMEGFSGLTSVTGYDDGTPPIRSAIPYGDPVAAVYGAIAAILGIRARRNGGETARFEISQHEGLVSLLPDILLEAQVTGADPGPAGDADSLLYELQGVAWTADGLWLAVSAGAGDGLERLRRAIGAGGTAGGAAKTWEAVAAWARGRTRDDAARALQEAGVMAGPVLSPGQMMNHEQVVARGVYANVEHPVAGSIPYSQLPVRLSGIESEPDEHAPLFGEHNDYVFRELLGMSEAEVAALYEAGVTSRAPLMG